MNRDEARRLRGEFEEQIGESGQGKTRAERTLRTSVRGRRDDNDDNFRVVGNSVFLFYKPATVIKLPAGGGSTVCIQHDKPDPPYVDATTFGLEEGFYLLDDGTIVLRVQSDGSRIDLIVDDVSDDAPGTAPSPADDGYNYRC